MLEILAILASLLLFVISLIATRSGSHTLLRPVVLFSGVWLLVFSLLPLNILPYVEIHGSTYVTLLCGNVLVVLGALFTALCDSGRTQRRFVQQGEPYLELLVLRRTIKLFMALGGVLFALFLFTVDQQFSFYTLLTSPHVVRSGFSGLAIQITIKYFYFTTPAAAMAFVHFSVSRKYRAPMLAVVIVSLLMSIATTGRTAPITILMWLILVRLYVRRHARPLEKIKTFALTLASCIAIALVFVYGGNWVGKTFDNSGFERKVSVTDSWRVAVIPYYYFTASVPALNNLLSDTHDYTYGAYTFLPVAKLVLPIAGREAPSEIAPETFIPYSANTYTYAYPFWRDGGLAGFLLGSIAIGIVTERAYLKMLKAERSAVTLLRAAFLAMCIVFTFGTNHFCSPFSWWCIAITYALDLRVARKLRRQAPVMLKASILTDAPIPASRL